MRTYLIVLIVCAFCFISCNGEKNTVNGCKLSGTDDVVLGRFGCYPDTIIKYNMQNIYDSCLWEVYKRFYNHTFYCRDDNYILKQSEITHSFQYLKIRGATGLYYGDTLQISFSIMLNDSLACYSSSYEFETTEAMYNPSFFCRKSMPDYIFGFYFRNVNQLFGDYFGYYNFRVRSNTFKNHYDYILYNFKRYIFDGNHADSLRLSYLQSPAGIDSIHYSWLKTKNTQDSLYKIQEQNFYQYLLDEKNNLPEHLKKEAIKRKIIRDM